LDPAVGSSNSDTESPVRWSKSGNGGYGSPSSRKETTWERGEITSEASYAAPLPMGKGALPARWLGQRQ
jgi:hypothetical protein